MLLIDTADMSVSEMSMKGLSVVKKGNACFEPFDDLPLEKPEFHFNDMLANWLCILLYMIVDAVCYLYLLWHIYIGHLHA